ncbi:hypothetical protein [Priestia sp. YIM B13448]|uniref:hypothetical protein n=1 Tax=Priestia sp. YIM B13448 TaxID=3366308 RepID=UPI00366B8EF1
MTKKILFKTVAVAIYVYILTFLLELIISGRLSNTFKISISTGIALMAYIQMYYKDVKNKQKG